MRRLDHRAARRMSDALYWSLCAGALGLVVGGGLGLWAGWLIWG